MPLKILFLPAVMILTCFSLYYDLHLGQYFGCVTHLCHICDCDVAFLSLIIVIFFQPSSILLQVAKYNLKTYQAKIINGLHILKLKSKHWSNRFAYLASFLLSNQILKLQLYMAQKVLYLKVQAEKTSLMVYYKLLIEIQSSSYVDTSINMIF